MTGHLLEVCQFRLGCVDKKDTQQQRTIYCLLLLYLPTLEFEHGF